MPRSSAADDQGRSHLPLLVAVLMIPAVLGSSRSNITTRAR